jgi:hypothetical protein
MAMPSEVTMPSGRSSGAASEPLGVDQLRAAGQRGEAGDPGWMAQHRCRTQLVGPLGLEKLVAGAYPQARAANLQHVVGKRHGAGVAIALAAHDEPIHGAEIVRQHLAVRGDLERCVERGSMRIVQRHIGMDAASHGERAPGFVEREAFAPLHAPAAVEALDEYRLGAHGFHSMTST